LQASGLSLAQVSHLLGKQRSDIRTSLDMHRATLLAQRDKIDQALALVDVARRRVAAGEVLDPEALAARCRINAFLHARGRPGCGAAMTNICNLTTGRPCKQPQRAPG
jgi:hypothetical protein